MTTKPTSGKPNSVSANPNQKKCGPVAVLFSYKPSLFILVFLSVLILSTSFQSGRNESVQVESEYVIPELISGLKASLSETGFQPQSDNIGIALYDGVRQFYALHKYRPAWTTYNHLNRNGASLVSLITNAREYGLEPVHYHIDKILDIRTQMETRGNRSRVNRHRLELEILLTDAALKLMVNLHSGYRAFDSTLLSSGQISQLPVILMEGIKKEKPVGHILSVQPRFIEYGRLQTATANYVRNTHLSADTLFTTEADKDSAEFYDRVRNALLRLGYSHKQGTREEISAGLKELQKCHGLERDGKPSKNTLDALQMTPLCRYRMLALNLDRLRKQDHSEIDLLYVNIPAYQLKVYRQNRLLDTYRVIVGTPETPTPRLVSKVERVIANPVWDVPASIAQNELLPKIKADTGYLRRNRFRLVDRNNKIVDYQQTDLDRISISEYSIRQESSSDNALGKVKFIFSNPYSVFLHDTPGRSLFAKDTRDMSHGCIRLQNPEKLANYLVNTVQSDSTDITGLISRGIRREYNLGIAVPIHISYITCDADDKGNLYFYRDVYGLDEKELTDLKPFMGI